MRAKERLPRKHYSLNSKWNWSGWFEEEGSIAALARKHDVNDNLLFKWIRLWQRGWRVCRPRKTHRRFLP
jgi:transposase